MKVVSGTMKLSVLNWPPKKAQDTVGLLNRFEELLRILNRFKKIFCTCIFEYQEAEFFFQPSANNVPAKS